MFKLISGGIFLLIICLCFWLPYRQSKRQLASIVSSILILIFLPTILSDLDYLIIIPSILAGIFSLIFISYWTLINLRLKKAGQIVAIIFSILAVLPFLSLALEDYWFFKSDAKELLLENQIILKDDFKIKSNQITGLIDLYQKFEIEISDKDKNRIFKQLKQSKYFKDTVKTDRNLQLEMGMGLMKKVFRDYERPTFFVRESYQHLKEGYSSDYDIIIIPKNENVLTFERINE